MKEIVVFKGLLSGLAVIIVWSVCGLQGFDVLFLHLFEKSLAFGKAFFDLFWGFNLRLFLFVYLRNGLF